MLERRRFLNKFYMAEATQEVITEIPITSPWALQEWRELYFKWSSYGHYQFDQNRLQSQVENSTNQAEEFALQIEMRNELRLLLERQEAVLKKLESQVMVVEEPIPLQEEAKEEQKEDDESSQSFSIEDGGSSSVANTSQLKESNNNETSND